MRRSPSIPRRRSVALLLVVAALAIVAVGAATLAAMASTAKVVASLDRSEEIAGELLAAAEAPIRHWLSHVAPTAVAPPEAAAPALAVLDESWEFDGVPVELRATAFDQLGMVPWSHARGGSTLRLVLPADVASTMEKASHPKDVPPGMDLLAAEHERPVFPLGWGEGGEARIGVGALVATHGSAPARINVNTAPAPLLEQAFRAAGRGGVDAVLASRGLGKPAPLPGPPAAERRRGGGAAAEEWRVELVGASDAWAVRIDIRAGQLRRGWWEVHRPGSEGKWECVQRLVILE